MSEKIKVKIYTNQKSPRLFKNKLLEFLTKTHPLVIDTMYIIIAYFLISYYHDHFDNRKGFIVLLFFTGFFSWTLAEYLMHRFLYHKIEDATYDTGIQYLFHGIHHEYPDDRSRTVLPVIPSLFFASVFFGLFYLVMGKYAFVVGPGFLIGYISYMTVHYSVHHFPAPKRFNFWWTFHNIHHYQQHDRAFGVTNPFWDIVFGTMPEKGRRTVEVEVGKKEEKAKMESK